MLQIGLLNNRATKKVISLVSKKTPEEQNNILAGLEAELKKLSKKKRKRAEKMLKLFEKGQVLRPDEDIDNKQLMLDNK